jgi:peptidoglycan lytic transglycosylase G
MRRGLLVALVIIAAGAAVTYGLFTRWLATPLATGDAPVQFEIPSGQPLAVTARQLESHGWLARPRWFVAYARMTGADARVRAGEYEISPGTSPRQLLALFESGKVVQHTVTLVEGWTFRDLQKALEQQPQLEHTLNTLSPEQVMQKLDEPGKPPEGLFFPDTYVFGKGTSDLEILRQARVRMREKLEAAWKARAADVPLASPYEALILASIVEKETALPAERPRIAGVFTTRLRQGMRLQTDPTVIYGLGAGFDGNLRRSDLERDGPYNTYTRVGLPPTPIAMPGAGALEAAVRPDERGELYFVATGLPDGSHTFSRTLSEHEAAVGAYLARLRQRRTEN